MKNSIVYIVEGTVKANKSYDFIMVFEHSTDAEKLKVEYEDTHSCVIYKRTIQ